MKFKVFEARSSKQLEESVNRWLDQAKPEAIYSSGFQMFFSPPELKETGAASVTVDPVKVYSMTAWYD